MKWLGQESSEQDRWIKAVNKHPPLDLMMVWPRQEETYCSLEAIEHALFTKLDNFPGVTIKEPHRVHELADLLLQVDSAGVDRYLRGVSYFET